MAELNLMYYKRQDEILPEVELDICKYIADNKDEIYEDVLVKESRWEIFYHLSEMRTSILNWYDFGYNVSVLEVGGGFGAITGMLCSRVKSVTVVEKSILKAEAISKRYHNRDNLIIYAGEINEIDFCNQFDYVIVEGAVCKGENGTLPEKQLEQYVRMSKKWLKDAGILLLAVDNYNGAKYQCGYPKPIMGSINENGCEAMVTKEQLNEIIINAGFECLKFYYPFPDYRFPQEIYTDAKFPEKNIRSRILNYYVLSDMLIRDEYEFYEEEVQKGDIRKVCNSYLVECGRRSLCSDAEYVAVSTDRGRKHGFATIVCKNQVIKKPLYNEGKPYLRKSYDNIVKIQERGISAIPHNYQDDMIIMPTAKSPKLIERLFELAVENKEKFIQAIDKIYQCIMKSSDKLEMNGEIYLENGYIDMIPLNCFDEQGEYCFFDQEFCERQCELSYIMFRVLRYTYLTYPQLDTYVRLEDMKELYGLCDRWQKYLMKEDDFIWNNRQHDINHILYEWIANGGVGKPIAIIGETCGLYLAKGFDVQEKDESNVWAWAVKSHAGICIRNFTERRIRVRVQFMLGSPPGMQRRRIEVYRWKEKGEEVYAPITITRDEEILANDLLFIGFNTIGNLTKCDNGDLREFAFQLLNPQIVLI